MERGQREGRQRHAEGVGGGVEDTVERGRRAGPLGDQAAEDAAGLRFTDEQRQLRARLDDIEAQWLAGMEQLESL